VLSAPELVSDALVVATAVVPPLVASDSPVPTVLVPAVLVPTDDEVGSTADVHPDSAPKAATNHGHLRWHALPCWLIARPFLPAPP
jgi:hypothetical protein